MALRYIKKSSRSQKGDPTKLLTRAYILAFLLIALVSLSGHFVTSSISKQQRISTEVAYELNKQRTEMQQIISYAPHYDRLGDALDIRFIYKSLSEVERSHKFILAYLDQTNILGNYISEALRRVYFSAPYIVADQIDTFLKNANIFLSTSDNVTDEQKKVAIDDMKYFYENFIQPALELASSNYQTEIIDKINGYQRIQHFGIALVLLVLLAEAVFIFRPLIARIENYNRMMKRYALEDGLTGLSNRRAFMNRAVIELNRSMRDGMPVAVALLDLDHFKSVNDTYGHDVGDLVLKHFSKVLKSSFRSSDVIGRVGGEEFAIILPKTQLRYAYQIFSKLTKRVEETPCPYRDENGTPRELDYTVSVGFVGIEEVKNTDIDAYIKQADEALYHTKENGRNGVTCYNHMMDPDSTTTELLGEISGLSPARQEP